MNYKKKMEGDSSKKAYLAAILIQLIYAGMFLLSKAAFDVGMNTYIFVFYRQAAATVFLLPLAFFFEWKSAPPLSFATFLKIFMLSLFGITLSLNLYGVALIYTSASLAAATTNCLPVITFFLALLLRMERVKVRTAAGIAKVIGIAICISGATVIAFYKGPPIKLLLPPHHLFLHSAAAATTDQTSSSTFTWIKGCFLMLTGNTFWGLWLVFQARVMKSYPAKLVSTTLQCLLSTIQSFLVAVAVERDPNQWKLQWNVRLLSVVYCGIVVTGITYYLQAWVIEKKGPVFIAMSTPLALLFTMLSSSLLLGEIISLGSVLGGMLLVGGLYSVLWGKSREHDDEVKKQLQLQLVAITTITQPEELCATDDENGTKELEAAASPPPMPTKTNTLSTIIV
ncbi:WAT1-related protein At5g64700 [Diospyros lotus]|uniref:WAT1-related protein At5g64700 n=1 Tax=Diospyros lotus TaxID=55363 RepID=UPI0022541A7D|nr:WAT1-related protein At5g64700 [Diospyros lotus]